jgi:ankyrin repeat protein
MVVAFFPAYSGSYEDFFKGVELDLDGRVAELLARGFDPNSLSEAGQTALYLALRDDSPKVAAVLLASPDLKVDLANRVGETALMMAALRGDLNTSVELIRRGAAVRRKGWTPLHYAASGPQASLVALMLKHGAEINAQAPNGNTALMMAAGYGQEESVTLLLESGADKTLVNEQGKTAQDYARISGREFLVEKLN